MSMSVADGVFGTALRARAIVLGATIVAYATSFDGPFQFDDAGVIVNAPAVHSWSAYRAAALHGLRPLLKLFYTANWTLGVGPLAFHVFNLLVHLLNVELVMRLCGAALDRASRAFGLHPSGAVLAAGLLFGVHPIQTEAVTYISGGSAALVTSFVLLALLAYACAARLDRPWPALMLALVLFLCAVATKETAIGLPFGLLLWDLCIERASARRILVRQAPFWGVLLALFVAFVMHPAYFKLLYAITGTRPLLQASSYQIAGAGYLASRLLLVHRLCIDPGLFLRPPTAAELAASSALLLSLVAIAWSQLRKRPAVAFGAAWLVFHMLFPYALLPRLDVANERHMYLANVGLAVALGAVWYELRERAGAATQRVLAALAGAVVCLLIAQTLLRNRDYRSEVALWESTVRVASENPRAHHNLGVAYERAGLIGAASDQYRAALELEPRYQSARANLARLERKR
jgi:hypothetical protein